MANLEKSVNYRSNVSFKALSRAREIAGARRQLYSYSLYRLKSYGDDDGTFLGEFQDPVPRIWFRPQRPYIRSGYFSDIDTLLLREAVSVSGVKIAAIESRSIRVWRPPSISNDAATYRGIW